MHFLSFKSGFNFKNPKRITHAHRATLSSSFHHIKPLVAVSRNGEKREGVKRCFFVEDLECRKCIQYILLNFSLPAHARPLSPYDFFVNTVCGHSGILSRGCWLCLVVLIWFCPVPETYLQTQTNTQNIAKISLCIF